MNKKYSGNILHLQAKVLCANFNTAESNFTNVDLELHTEHENENKETCSHVITNNKCISANINCTVCETNNLRP